MHPKTHQFVWIPWDLNEAFAGFAPGGDPGEQMNLSVDHPYSKAFIKQRVDSHPEFSPLDSLYMLERAVAS